MLLLLAYLVIAPLIKDTKKKKEKKVFTSKQDALISKNKELVSEISSLIDFKLDELAPHGGNDYLEAISEAKDLIESMNSTIDEFSEEEDIEISIASLLMLEKELTTVLEKISCELSSNNKIIN
jgi:hypothetical protein